MLFPGYHSFFMLAGACSWLSTTFADTHIFFVFSLPFRDARRGEIRRSNRSSGDTGGENG